MAYRICRVFEIESGHMLMKHPDRCRFPHGHTRKVEVVLESDGLDHNEMVCDYKILKEVMRDCVEAHDHALCINSREPSHDTLKGLFGERLIAFKDEDPTTEVMARIFYETCRDRLESYLRRKDTPYPLRGEVKVVRVRVWETSSTWAEYEE